MAHGVLPPQIFNARRGTAKGRNAVDTEYGMTVQGGPKSKPLPGIIIKSY